MRLMRTRHGHVHPSEMSYLAHVHVLFMSTHQRCGILLMRTWCSCPPIRDVAFCSIHAHVMVMPTHQSCRILLMRTSCSCSPITDVALWNCSCARHAHVHPSEMGHFAHAHVLVMFTHQRCRMRLVSISRSCPPIRDVALIFAHARVVIMFAHQRCRNLVVSISRVMHTK